MNGVNLTLSPYKELRVLGARCITEANFGRHDVTGDIIS